MRSALRWTVLLLAAAGGLRGEELAGQTAHGDGPGMPDAWRAAVYSFRLEPRGAAALELLQLLPRAGPAEGRFLRVRVDRDADRYERQEGRYRIEGAELILRYDGTAARPVERARYYGTLICLDDPAGTGSRAFRFVHPRDRHAPPPPWPPRQGRPPASC